MDEGEVHTYIIIYTDKCVFTFRRGGRRILRGQGERTDVVATDSEVHTAHIHNYIQVHRGGRGGGGSLA